MGRHRPSLINCQTRTPQRVLAGDFPARHGTAPGTPTRHPPAQGPLMRTAMPPRRRLHVPKRRDSRTTIARRVWSRVASVHTADANVSLSRPMARRRRIASVDARSIGWEDGDVDRARDRRRLSSVFLFLQITHQSVSSKFTKLTISPAVLQLDGDGGRHPAAAEHP